MKDTFSFKIESQLHGIENPKGSIEQVLLAQNIAKHEGLGFFNRIALVTFGDATTNKEMHGAVPTNETLLFACEDWNNTLLYLCIRSEKSVCKIATGSFQKITIHKEYRHTILLNKLSDKEIAEIFKYVWDNLEIIQPTPRCLED
ncbi:hypothetical protein ACL9RF_01920 [Sphingobacterium sp. Mn56C]|uniref:hypothetical protein n=1 Tax=Sphingobacterium sp. Mn56C TaxID=3395261 RepID=UPI003BEB45D1